MQSPRVKILFLTAMTAVLVALSLPAASQEEQIDELDENGLNLFDSDVERTREGWSRFNLAVGLAYLDADGILAARLPGEQQVTIIDFDRVGLKETDSSHWLSMTWRSDKSRWGAWFANWRYDVNGARSWENEIELPNGPLIPVGARVESKFDASWYILEATYSFFRSETLDAGIGFGIHTVDVDTRLAVQVEIGEGQVELGQGDLATLAPLPNILAFVNWEFLPGWDLGGRLGWFGFDYDNYSGQMTNAYLMVSYAISDRFSLGGAFQFVSLDVDVEEERYTQKYDVDFDGPMAILRFRF